MRLVQAWAITAAPFLVINRVSRDQAIDEEEYYRADDRSDEARWMLRFIAPNQSAEITGSDKRACNTEQDGDDATAGISARGQELSDRAND